MSAGLVTNHFFHNPVITAIGATWGENLGFYGRILYADVLDRKRRDQEITLVGLLKVLRNAIVEFGPAEYLDSFLIRPITMYFFPQITGNIVIGLFLGKISADVTFYVPTVIAYELRKKHLNN